MLAQRIRELPGVRGKAAIGVVADVFGGGDWWAGPGDDGAVVPLPDSAQQVVACGEAMLPAFVRQDPFGAGVASVVANVNDLAAMGAQPLALVDTVVGPPAMIRRCLEGLQHAGRLYRVPVVGGHLSELPENAPAGSAALSVFGLGSTRDPLSARRAEPGHDLVLACCLQGEMRADFPFFRSIHLRGEQLADDVRLLPGLAARGVAAAAKDVSMPGVIGSLAMLLEPNRLGVRVDLDRVPTPAGVSVADWLCCFPTFAFLICCPPDRTQECLAGFAERDLAAARIGVLDNSGLLRLGAGRDGAVEEQVVFDLTREAITGLAR